MNLAQHQRAMLRLVRFGGDAASADDAYVGAVAASRDLQEARHNVFLWRAYVLAHTAPLTFNLLKHRGLLKAALDEYIARHNLSPYRETHAPLFLEQMSAHPDPTVARVARFEAALRLARRGDARSWTIGWDRDPVPLLAQLAQDRVPDDGASAGAPHEVHVSRHLRGCFDVRALT